ncbi:MAG: hypothetical protein JRI40_08270 [Deltaproteobacteria bacterium]|nr:hypothetical protein [Deltaproteobacteria bacterium]
MDFYRDMCYTALCVGKRDLAGSTMFLLEETKKRGLRPLSSNLRYKGKAVFEPYGIFDVNGTKVGVLAVTSPELNQRIKTDGIEVLDPSARLKSLVPELKNRVDVIILLSNLSELEDRNLSSTVDGLDIIIESGPGKQRYQPLKVENTYLLRGNIKGKSVGKVWVKLNSEGGIQELDNELHQLKSSLPVDEAATKKIKKLKQKYSSHKAVTTSTSSAKNPFLEAIERAKKRKGQAVQTNATATNPFIELLKKRGKTLGGPSQSSNSTKKSVSEVREPESSPEN